MIAFEKPYSPACDRNKEPILELLKSYIKSGRLLEIGTGTGQHAVYFAKNLTNIEWQTSDVQENHAGIQMWLDEAQLSNVKNPISFQIGRDTFPKGEYDFVYTANTLHIMSWDEVQSLITLLGENSKVNSKVFFYGPFKYNGEYTSKSNLEFDLNLQESNPKKGIRDFEKVQNLMQEAGFDLLKDHEMPANNRMLVFEKKTES